MKKAITILAVLIVLASAVFAAETHTIKVKADVTEVLPAFQFGIIAPAEVYRTNNPTGEGEEPAKYTTTTYNELNEGTAKDVNFNLDENGEVNLAVYVANLAKTNKNFTFTFSDGVFKVSRGGVRSTTNEQTGVTTYETHEPTSRVAAKGAAQATFYTTDISNNVPSVQFLGKTLTNNEKGSIVATAIFSYTGDPTIDPTGPGQYYYADITVEIATTN